MSAGEATSAAASEVAQHQAEPGGNQNHQLWKMYTKHSRALKTHPSLLVYSGSFD